MNFTTKMMFRVVLYALVPAVTVAQTRPTAIVLNCESGCPSMVKGVRPGGAPEDTMVTGSFVHMAVLRDIKLTDTLQMNQAIFRQSAEIWDSAGKQWIDITNKGKAAPAEEKEANHKLHRAMFDKLLPELRPLIPADQQSIFDRNLKQLQENDYTIATAFKSDTTAVPYLVGCFQDNRAYRKKP